MYKKIKQLSGGERRRVALAKLVLDRPDVLLLDEPTTHLDLTTLEALEGALRTFPGAMLFVSHDRYFLDRLAERLLLLGGGAVASVPGPYHRYRESLTVTAPATSPGELRGHLEVAQAPDEPDAAPRAPSAPAKTAAGMPAASKPAPQARKPVRGPGSGPADDEIAADELLQRIALLEQEVGDLGRLMGDPELYRDAARAREAVQRYEEVTAALESLYAALESGDRQSRA